MVPWKGLVALIEPHYPKGEGGRPAYPLMAMLRVHLMQNWFGYSDPAMEEALYEITSLRQFAQLSLTQGSIPEDTTIMNFRHLLEQHGLAAGILAVILAAALIGSRDESGETVPAGEWAESVCGAVGVWRGEVESLVEDLRTPNAAAGSEEPQSETPQGRTGFIRVGVERAVQATETMVLGVENAGVPDTANGERVADVITSWADEALDQLEEAQDSLDEEADSLEGSIEQLTGAARAIGSVLASGTRAVADVVRADPELAAVIRDTSTCQELREESS